MMNNVVYNLSGILFLFFEHQLVTQIKTKYFVMLTILLGRQCIYLVSSEYLSSAHEGDVHILSSAQVLAENKERQDFHSKQKVRHRSFRKSNIHISLLCDNAFNALNEVIDCDFHREK